MKVHELAKELGTSSKVILEIINVNADKPRTPSSNLTDEEADGIRKMDLLKEQTEPEPEPEEKPAWKPIAGSRFDGTLVCPPRLYKYARKRGVTLADAIEACGLLGIPNAREQMELDLERVQQLDQHFANLPNS